ncbi:MAG: three-Cys-motif partner protein TcmP [Verrucomicrobiales bacterium]
MPRQEIDDKPFNQSTLTKLDLFERYAREWLPVFITGPVIYKEINICDFFSGSGTDSEATWGSSLRLLKVVKEFRGMIAQRNFSVSLYLSDKVTEKVARLKEHIVRENFAKLPINIDIKSLSFEQRFEQLHSIFMKPESANLLILDQYGVKHFDSTFDALVRCPTTDFLAFVSSSWFQRFHTLPEVAKYLVDRRPQAYHQAHRAVIDAYRKKVPKDRKYYLGEFSLKSGSNIYGVIFGSAHPLGMAKFLSSAWKLDETNGSANFDVEQEGIFGQSNLLLPFAATPKKVEVFDKELEQAIRSGAIRDEMQILELCFEHGVTNQHASPVLRKLRKEGIHTSTWWVPNPSNFRNPRILLRPNS